MKPLFALIALAAVAWADAPPAASVITVANVATHASAEASVTGSVRKETQSMSMRAPPS